VHRPHPQTRRHVIETLVLACVALCAWIVVLGLTLPRRYDAAHWNLAWIGFAMFLLYVVVRVVNATRGPVWSDQVGSRPRSLWSVEFAHPSEVQTPGADPVADHADGQAD